MSRALATWPIDFQRLSSSVDSSMQHGRDMTPPTDEIREKNWIIDQIIEQLRPWRYDEAHTRRVLAYDIAQLQERPRSNPGTDVKQSAENISRALTLLVSELERTSDPVLRGLKLLYADDFKRIQHGPLLDACDRLVLHKQRSVKFNSEQRACAIFAYDLVAGLSQKPPSGYGTGPFVTIAGLLYAAVSGKHDVDLRRHCGAELRVRKQQTDQPQT
jgi:hypothetical protein